MPPPAAVLKKKNSSKNPPILSQEYLIQNHGDIASGILMVFILGAMIHLTSPYFSAFLGLRHNVTNFESFYTVPPPLFNYGYKDLALLFAYTIVCILIHAIWQEYVLDKLGRKLHFSKSKIAKFFESGQLILFYVISVVWALLIFKDDGYFQSGLGYLWRDYPYTGMNAWTKFYFILQLCYWLHNFPELYLQKVRKEDIPPRVIYSSIYFIVVLFAYLTRFWRISLVLLTIHYFIEIFNHSSRLAHFYNLTKSNSPTAKSISQNLFKVWNVVFISGRLISVVLTWLTFWFGLSGSSISKISFTPTPITTSTDGDTPKDSVIIANFNTPTVRLFTLVITGSLQFWLVWNYIQFHMRRRRERRSARATATTPAKVPSKLKQKQKVQADGKSEDDEADENPAAEKGAVQGNKKGN